MAPDDQIGAMQDDDSFQPPWPSRPIPIREGHLIWPKRHKLSKLPKNLRPGSPLIVDRLDGQQVHCHAFAGHTFALDLQRNVITAEELKVNNQWMHETHLHVVEELWKLVESPGVPPLCREWAADRLKRNGIRASSKQSNDHLRVAPLGEKDLIFSRLSPKAAP